MGLSWSIKLAHGERSITGTNPGRVESDDSLKTVTINLKIRSRQVCCHIDHEFLCAAVLLIAVLLKNHQRGCEWL